MKFLTQSLLVAAILTMLAENVKAQIMWGPLQTITGNASDINTSGLYFDAINTIWNGTFTTTTVGDTTFNSLSLAGNTSDGTISDVIVPGDGNFHGVGAPDDMSTPANAAYGYVVNQASDASLGTVTIGSALHPLTLGQTYQVQVWGYWANTSYGAKLNGTPSFSFPNGGGGYTVGTFIAHTTSETFTYTGNAQSFGAGFINDIAVREIPEPSTYVLMLGGLAFLGFCVRRNRAPLK